MVLMAPFSLLFHERWPITLNKEMNVLSLNYKHTNRKNHQSLGEIEAIAGFGMVHALTPLSARYCRIAYSGRHSERREHAAREKAVKETSAQQSSMRAGTWKCEMHTKYFLFPAQWLAHSCCVVLPLLSLLQDIQITLKKILETPEIPSLQE